MAAEATPTIAGFAVIGKQNNPLFVKSFGTEDHLKFQFVVHTSLDIVDERLGDGKAGGAAAGGDLYLGLLTPIEDYKVYGYVTNTQAKLIVVTRDIALRDGDIKSLFKGLHGVFVGYMCNPFAALDEPITSKRFDHDVSFLIRHHSGVLTSNSGDCDPHVVAEVHGIGRTLAVRRPRRALGLSWMQAQLDAMPRVQAREGLPRRPVRDADSNGAL